MKKIITILSMSVLLSGCFTLPRISLPGPPKSVSVPKKHYNWQEKSVTKPQVVVSDGKIVVVQEVTKEIEVTQSAEITIKKLTILERIGGWISGLSVLFGVLLIVGLIFFPSMTLGFLFRKIISYKRALSETVRAVKDSQIVNDNKDLHDKLKLRQSSETKKIIGNIKSKL